MDVKEAVETAKRYVAYVLSDEGIQHVATEEVAFDEGKHSWKVTISFFRPENQMQGLAATLAGGASWKQRTFKIVEINRAGEAVSMTHRTFLLPVSN